MLAVCGVLLFFVLSLAGLTAFGIFVSSNKEKLSSSFAGEDAGVRDSACISVFYPQITDELEYANAINDYIDSVRSGTPLSGLGEHFINGGKKTGIHPAYGVAVAQIESTLGLFGIAADGTHNAFGRKATASQPHIVIKGTRWYYWPSWQESLYTTKTGSESWFDFIERAYIEQRDADTIEKIREIYCPDEGDDACGNKEYAEDVKDIMARINEIAGESITCD